MSINLITPRSTTLFCAVGIIVTSLVALTGIGAPVSIGEAAAVKIPFLIGLLLMLIGIGLICLAFGRRHLALATAIAITLLPVIELAGRYIDNSLLRDFTGDLDGSGSSTASLICIASLGLAIGRISVFAESARRWIDLDAIAALVTVCAVIGMAASELAAMADVSFHEMLRMTPATGGALLLAAGGLQGMAWQRGHRPGEPSTRLSVIVAAGSIGASLVLYHAVGTVETRALLDSLPIPEILLAIGVTSGMLAAAALYTWQVASHHSISSTSARQALDTEHAYLVEMLNTVESGVLTCDADSRLTHFNGAMQRLFGLKNEPFMGFAWAEAYRIYEPDGSTVIRWEETPLGMGIGGDPTDAREAVIYAGKSNPRRVLLTGRPIRSARGKITGAVMSATDITEFRDAEAQLQTLADQAETAERDLRHMVFAAAHTLQEPTRGITSYVQLLARRLGNDIGDDANEYIGHISDETKRMKAQLAGLLHWLEVAQNQSVPDEVNLQELAESAKQRADDESENDITERSPWINALELPTIRGDQQLLQEVFNEVVANAMRFNTSVLPQVDISARREDDATVIEFADNGIGIDKADRERVFTLFERLHNLDEFAGYGVGLAVCRKIIRAHGGTIEFVDPTEQVDGALLRIHLPDQTTAATDISSDGDSSKEPDANLFIGSQPDDSKQT